MTINFDLKLLDSQRQPKHFFSKRELLRLILLAITVIYAYSAFFTNHNLGAGPGDAQMYQYQLHDALSQLRQGIFPTYVGQSQFSYFGISFMRSPYYILLGQLLDLTTFHQLSALSIQHLTVLTSALGAAFLSYFLFTNLVPNLRWHALLFALFYITCPGVIGLIYRSDMYFSFMTIPYIPLAIYGLIRTHQKNDREAHFITAGALSLLWLAHPPIAAWVTLMSFFFYFCNFIFNFTSIRNNLVKPAGVFCLTLLLNFWQFASIYSMQLGKFDAYPGTSNKLDAVKVIHNIISMDASGAFLPIAWQSKTEVFLQLGYTLWLVLFVSFVSAMRRPINFINVWILTSSLIICLFLYPVPVLNEFFWSLLPGGFLKFNTWPMQRLYVILASLACFAGMLNLRNSFPKNSQKKITLLLGLLLCAWNLYEIHYFLNFGKTSTYRNSTWQISENLYFYGYEFSPRYGVIDVAVNETFIPQLKNTLLDKDQKPLANFSNEQTVLSACLKKSHAEMPEIKITRPNLILPTLFINRQPEPFLNIKTIEDNPYLFFCLEIELSKKNSLSMEAIDAEYVAYANTMNINGNKKKKTMLLPIYHPKFQKQIYHPLNDGITLYLKGKANIISYGLISYDLNNLPIHIQSFTPYLAFIKTKSERTYLDTGKIYYPGYKAYVNGKEVSVLKTQNKTVMIPLDNKGRQHIKLLYEGTPLMQAAFYFSGVIWILIGLYFLLVTYRLYQRSFFT